MPTRSATAMAFTSSRALPSACVSASPIAMDVPAAVSLMPAQQPGYQRDGCAASVRKQPMNLHERTSAVVCNTGIAAA